MFKVDRVKLDRFLANYRVQENPRHTLGEAFYQHFNVSRMENPGNLFDLRKLDGVEAIKIIRRIVYF